MPRHIMKPSRVAAVGSPPKQIEEFVGRVNTGTESLSVARMISPPGWTEPRQTPEFDEYTVVIRGAVRVEHDSGEFTARAGEAVHAIAGERIRYSTPEGAEYIAICIPAFSPNTVHREQ